MNESIKPTPGPWAVARMTPCRVDTASGAISISWSSNNDSGAREREAEANARLIAEAGTVHHETGLTPRQLVEQRDDLLAVLRNWLGQADDPNAGWRGVGGTDVLFACEHCFATHEDCTRLEHACDCPITLARAALAKCEGVKP